MEAATIPAPRTPLHLEVSFRRNYARETTTGVVKNISISGAYLECEGEVFKANDKLQLTFEVGGRTRKVMAQVIWLGSHGSGIKFLPTNNRDVQIIDDLIYFVENSRTDRRSVLDSIFKKVS